MDRLERNLNGVGRAAGYAIEHGGEPEGYWASISRKLGRGWGIERYRTKLLREELELYRDHASAEVVDRVEMAMEANRG